MSDPFLIILGLILLVMIVQVWSVQRVEKEQKQMKAHIITRNLVIDSNTYSNLSNKDIHRTIALALHRIDSLLLEKGISTELLLKDLIVDDKQESGVLPPAT